MRYWQMRAARLSRAAQKLDADGQWHPMTGTPNAWYRVGKGRVVQRVNFESDYEAKVLLPQISQVDPLLEMATVTGFREEVRIALIDDIAHLVLPLGYAPKELDAFRNAVGEYGIEVRAEDLLLYAYLSIAAVTRDELIYSQRVLVAVRLFFQAVTQAQTTNSLSAAMRAFRNSIESGESD